MQNYRRGQKKAFCMYTCTHTSTPRMTRTRESLKGETTFNGYVVNIINYMNGEGRPGLYFTRMCLLGSSYPLYVPSMCDYFQVHGADGVLCGRDAIRVNDRNNKTYCCISSPGGPVLQ